MNSGAEWRIDPDQWDAAIEAVDGPQIVVAGPGAGKTEFLVRRAIYLIRNVVDRADEVTILTFSRRAATDLRRRIAAGVGRSVTTIASSTFHSFAARLLESAGRPQNLLTGPEQVALVAELLSAEDPARWPPNMRGLLNTATFAADTTDFLLRCLERLIDPDALQRRALDRPQWRSLPRFFARYQDELVRRDRTDYGSLLVRAIAALGDSPANITTRYVIIDEYQDTSPAQAELADRLTAGTRNLTAAADPYQSVYSFRGADLENVAEFPERFRSADGYPARRIVLTESFRVPAPILESALRITGPGGLPGATGPVRPASHTGSVEAYVFDQASAEAEWIAAEVERLHLVDRIPYPEIAVLLRTKRRLLAELSRALGRRNIPHEKPDVRLVDHPAVKTVFDLAQAAALVESASDEAELDTLIRRILLGFLFALPISKERELHRSRLRSGSEWPELLARSVPDGEPLAELLADAAWATGLSAADGFWHAWTTLPQFESVAALAGAGEHRAAWSSLAQALGRQAERDPEVTLIDYRRMTADEDFEATPLLGYSPPEGTPITLTTLHQSKGLQFEAVFIADAAESVFPDLRRGLSLLDQQALSGPDRGVEYSRFRLQEEMRLAYSAVTKARSRVIWTATSAGTELGATRPSRFMLAAAGVATVEELGKPPARDRPPLTGIEAAARLRRTAADPAARPADRLAAVAVLAGDPASIWDASTFAGTRERGPDTGLVDGRLVLSPSQADLYQTCPRKYVLERRLGITRSDSPYAHYGSLVHRVLERCERGAVDSGQHHATLEEALAAVDEVWVDAEFGALNHVWRDKAIELVTRLWEDWPPDSREPVALEKPLRLELDGITWVGRADRIERTAGGGLRLVDYKTSKSILSFDRAKAAIQLGFYLLAAREDPELGGGVDEAEFWFPAAKAKTWRRPFDPALADEVRRTLIEIGNDIRSERWDPRVGDGCSRCAVRGVCPRWPEGKEAFAQ